MFALELLVNAFVLKRIASFISILEIDKKFKLSSWQKNPCVDCWCKFINHIFYSQNVLGKAGEQKLLFHSLLTVSNKSVCRISWK